MSTFHTDPSFFQTRILIHKPNLLEVEVKNASLPFLNSIRRIILEELPAYAITKININKYQGLLPEEILAHRIGQIPIFLDPSENIQFSMKIIKKGPGDVKTNDIKVFDGSGNEISSFSQLKENIPNSKDLPMIKQNVLITKQIAEDYLDIDMYATRSNAKDHSKHSVVTICHYRLIREIKLTKKFTGEDAILLQRILTEDVVGIRNGDAFLIKNTAELGRIMNVEDGIKIVDETEENAVFVIETEFLDPLDVFLRGVSLLMEKSKNLKEEIKNYLED